MKSEEIKKKALRNTGYVDYYTFSDEWLEKYKQAVIAESQTEQGKDQKAKELIIEMEKYYKERKRDIKNYIYARGVKVHLLSLVDDILQDIKRLSDFAKQQNNKIEFAKEILPWLCEYYELNMDIEMLLKDYIESFNLNHKDND